MLFGVTACWGAHMSQSSPLFYPGLEVMLRKWDIHIHVRETLVPTQSQSQAQFNIDCAADSTCFFFLFSSSWSLFGMWIGIWSSNLLLKIILFYLSFLPTDFCSTWRKRKHWVFQGGFNISISWAIKIHFNLDRTQSFENTI